MNERNIFNTRLAAPKMPDHFKDAAIELTDTLDVCWAAAQAVFAAKAKPEHALTLLPMFMARADEKHRQQLAQLGFGMDGAPLPKPGDQ